MKHTPLFSAHQKLGGKLIEFGGWEMPVYYTSIVDEHNAVRRAAGLFDISHMGEVFVRGAGAAGFLNATLTNDISRLVPGLGQYTLMCTERGGVVDDLYAYRLAPDEYLLIVNASRVDDDVAWLRRQLTASAHGNAVELADASAELAAVALQGPRAVEIVAQCFPGAALAGAAVARVVDLKKNEVGQFSIGGQNVWISRTGYTGEDGFEIVAPAAGIEATWEALLRSGASCGLKPCGLGARDTLRTEACYPLYGHELDLETTPIEAGLGFFVALDKGDFAGRSVLARQKAEGTGKKLAAFKMPEKSAPPRPGYEIFSSGLSTGLVASGTQSPTLGVGIGLGYVRPECAKAQTPLEIEIRGRRVPALVVPKPFYRKPA